MPQTKLHKHTVHYLHQREFHSIKREIFTQGIYEIELDRSDPIIVDIGAHIGLASLFWLTRYPLAHIWAVEPHPTSFELLQQNIWDNHLEQRITPVHAAIVPPSHPEGSGSFLEANSMVELHVDPELEWLSTASLLPHGWTGQEATAAVSVPSMTLDQLSLPNQTIDLLKLDIEGLETELLRSADTFLARCRHILVEHHPAPNNSLTDLTKLLETAGFLVETEEHELGLWLVRGQR